MLGKAVQDALKTADQVVATIGVARPVRWGRGPYTQHPTPDGQASCRTYASSVCRVPVLVGDQSQQRLGDLVEGRARLGVLAPAAVGQPLVPLGAVRRELGPQVVRHHTHLWRRLQLQRRLQWRLQWRLQLRQGAAVAGR